MISQRREKFSPLGRAVGKAFSVLPLNPNQWTALSLLPAIAGLYFAYAGQFAYSLVFFAATTAIDMIDGAVARFRKSDTLYGAYLDTVVDRYIEFAMIVSVLFLELPDFYAPAFAWLTLLLFGSLISSYSKAASAEKNIMTKGIHGVKGGLVEHPERMLLMLLIFLAVTADYRVFAAYVLAALAILVNVSAVQRVHSALGIAQQNNL